VHGTNNTRTWASLLREQERGSVCPVATSRPERQKIMVQEVGQIAQEPLHLFLSQIGLPCAVSVVGERLSCTAAGESKRGACQGTAG
jgi:hypothetical protein